MSDKNIKKTKKTKKDGKPFFKETIFPLVLLTPVRKALGEQLVELKARRKKISQEDPFKVLDRVGSNAATDADAEEQVSHARTVAVREQLDKKIIQTRRALTRIKIGSYGQCEMCGKMIDTDRLMVYPEVGYCVSCEKKREKRKGVK